MHGCQSSWQRRRQQGRHEWRIGVFCLLPTVVTGRQRSAVYDGASPCSALYVSRHSLNWTRCGTGSQWRQSRSMCFMCLLLPMINRAALFSTDCSVASCNYKWNKYFWRFTCWQFLALTSMHWSNSDPLLSHIHKVKTDHVHAESWHTDRGQEGWYLRHCSVWCYATFNNANNTYNCQQSLTPVD